MAPLFQWKICNLFGARELYMYIYIIYICLIPSALACSRVVVWGSELATCSNTSKCSQIIVQYAKEILLTAFLWRKCSSPRRDDEGEYPALYSVYWLLAVTLGWMVKSWFRTNHGRRARRVELRSLESVAKRSTGHPRCLASYTRHIDCGSINQHPVGCEILKSTR